MKKSLVTISALLCLAFFYSGKVKQVVYGYCKKDYSLEKCKKDIFPYRYDGFKHVNVVPKPYDQIKEVAIPIYEEVKYRIVFNQEGLEEGSPITTVQVYDKPMADKTKNLIYESKEKHFTFDVPDDVNSTRIFVNYILPSTKVEFLDVEDEKGKKIEGLKQEIDKKGCMIFVVAFEN